MTKIYKYVQNFIDYCVGKILYIRKIILKIMFWITFKLCRGLLYSLPQATMPYRIFDSTNNM